MLYFNYNDLVKFSPKLYFAYAMEFFPVQSLYREIWNLSFAFPVCLILIMAVSWEKGKKKLTLHVLLVFSLFLYVNMDLRYLYVT